MQWILVASVLTWHPVYDTQETCQIAAEELKKVYYQEVAACLPRPAQEDVNDNVERMFEQFLGMVKELQAIEQKELDSNNN